MFSVVEEKSGDKMPPSAPQRGKFWPQFPPLGGGGSFQITNITSFVETTESTRIR